MDLRELVARVRDSAPFTPGEAERAVEVTVRALVSYLPSATGRRLAGDLALEEAANEIGPPVPPHERAGQPAPPGVDAAWLAELAAHVARAEAERGAASGCAPEREVSPARALEHLQIVGHALAEELDDGLLDKLRRELPSALADLLRADARASWATPALHHARTLAEGRPGSRRSLSTAAPGSEHPLSEAHGALEQHHSVAEANPHADTKLSSAAGLTQEREHESLARGRAPKP